MLKRLFSLMAAVALAAAVAFYLVVPGGQDAGAPGVAAQDEQQAEQEDRGGAPAATPQDGSGAVEAAPGADRGADSAAAFDDDGGPREMARLPTPVQQVPAPRIGELDLANLPFDVQCGLQLSRTAEDPVLFASGVSLDPNAGGPAAMEIDGELLLLARAGVGGKPIGFGQFSRQLYQDETGAVSVTLDLTVEPSEFTDRSARTHGRLVVMKPERSTAELEVSGSAGC